MIQDDPLADARAALLDHLPKAAILARYQAAGGKELTSGKFASRESSAALAANAFGLFADHPEWLSLPGGLVPRGAAQHVDLERQMRFPWRGGYHPWLDVGIETQHALIGIESKRYEPFRDPKKAVFSLVYSEHHWGEGMASFEAMRDALSPRRSFEFLDAVQLVKHAFGLRTQAQKLGRRAVLCYLYAEPKAYPDGRTISATDIAKHREELAAFTREISSPPSDVAFCSLSYGDLITHWSADTRLADHATALATKFDDLGPR